ncbi:MAG: biotin/lipoate A/B protein ligase family protein [Candidatus Aminicenantes bacterium]
MNNWFLILEKEAAEGAYNMAVDDFLFKSLGSKPRTFVRFYSWKRPTVSLGYSQDTTKVINLDFCRKNNIDIVRRITGGKLVLHHREVTYSICSSDKKTFSSSLNKSYKLISKALIKGLKELNIPAYLEEEDNPSYSRSHLPCFSYPARNEIKVKGKKIVGSAQKRVGSKFIQHGSIPLERDDELLQSVSFLKEREEKIRMITIPQAANKKISYSQLVNHLISGVQEFFDIELKGINFSKKQEELIKKIQKDRYENKGWIYRKGAK